MATVNEVYQSNLSLDNCGTYRFGCSVTYRGRKYAVAFTCVPDYYKDHARLFPNNLYFLESDVKPSSSCISEIKQALRNYKLNYK